LPVSGQLDGTRLSPEAPKRDRCFILSRHTINVNTIRHQSFVGFHA
jgi:hypothetical protein